MFKDKFLLFLEHEKRYSIHTLKSYSTDLQQFFNFLSYNFKIKKVKDVNFQLVRSWITQLLNNKISSRSVNRKITTLKTYFRFLLREDIIKQSPMIKIVSPKTSKRLPVFIEEAKMKELLEDVDFGKGYVAERDRLILEIFYFTGIRLTELINIKKNDIDFSNNTILVLGKRNKERLIPVTVDIISKIRDLSNFYKSSYLFSNENGKRMSSKQVYRLVNKHLSKVTSLDKRSPHILRHTFATHMLNNGADINAIKELLGHTSLNATQIYTHNTIEKLKTVYKQAHPRG